MSECVPPPSVPLTTTISLDADLNHPVSRVWNAFAETTKRISWGVPAGEAMVYDHDDFRTGGSFRARCGTPDELEFASFGQYCAVEPERYFTSTETVSHGETILSASLITW